MILNERETPEGRLVAVCDDGLLGRTFEDGAVSITVTEEFYGGDEVDDEAAVAALGRADVANIVGEKAVAVAVEHGFVRLGFRDT
ncbi:DUF424 domain-containing protein [Halobacteriales archaeon SW_7_68_16]|nr:MAG: DUF424 domain-containing protein [Halobacteriales archaeon SW_7_68_16]